MRAEHVTLLLGDGDEQIKALDDVSVDVAQGELLMVVGPSGAGKSSLLAVCGGLRTPTEGHVWVDDREITGLSAAQLAEVRRKHIGFVFQQSNLVPALTALDQLLLLVHMAGCKPGSADREKAMSLLKEVGMADKAQRRSNQLSGGERQRVGIARAFMTNPSLLLVDEPTSMLDSSRGRKIVELLGRSCHDHQVATMMVTHDRGVLDAADRVMAISDGRLSAASADDLAANAPEAVSA